MSTTAIPTTPTSLKGFMKGPPRVSQVTLARRLGGVKQSHISMFLSGERGFSNTRLLRLARVTGVSMERLAEEFKRRRKEYLRRNH